MSIADTAIQALNAFSTRQMVTANNIANVNTNGFKSQRAELQTGPGGQGVRVGSISTSEAPGSLVPSLRPRTQPDGTIIQTPHMVESSNTDLAHEMVNMMVDSTAYSASAAMIRTSEEMTGTLLDMVV